MRGQNGRRRCSDRVPYERSLRLQAYARDPVAQAGLRLAGIDIQRIPLDEALPIIYVYLLRNLDKEEREEMIFELDKPFPQSVDDSRTAEEIEDDDLLAYLGASVFRQSTPTPPAPDDSVVD